MTKTEKMAISAMILDAAWFAGSENGFIKLFALSFMIIFAVMFIFDGEIRKDQR